MGEDRTAAERQRRRRARMRAGAIFTPVDVPVECVEMLIADGTLSEAQAEDEVSRGRAIASLLQRLIKKVTA